jgi:preprotein translocase subunit YajC
MSGQPPVFLQPQFMMIIFMMVIMYMILIRPQQQKQKEHDKMLKAIEKNDEVVTSSGIHGTVASVDEKTLMVRIADNVKIEIEKTAIAAVTKKQK